MNDCSHCSEPQISLYVCPVCRKGFCDYCTYHYLFKCNGCSELVCPTHIEREVGKVVKGRCVAMNLCTDCRKDNELAGYKDGDPANMLTQKIRELQK